MQFLTLRIVGVCLLFSAFMMFAAGNGHFLFPLILAVVCFVD